MITICKQPLIQLDVDEESTDVLLNRELIATCKTQEELNLCVFSIHKGYIHAINHTKRLLSSDDISTDIIEFAINEDE